FGIEQDYDYIALSFVRTARDVEAVRAILDFSGSKMKIIAKIESTQGVENLDEILKAADGLMVARGDMGVELPPEQVPYIQKQMIAKANAAGKITICATQMLESMTHNPRPTRAEVGDVANAVYDGATAVMLSGESAAGEYPLESVRMMAKIAEETEKHLHNVYQAVDDSQRSIVGKAACDLADVLGVEKIIVYTDTGRSPAVVSQIKPKTPIIVMTRNEKVYYQSALLYGVEPVRIADIIEDENLEFKTREYMSQVGMKSAILLFGHAIDSIKVLNS
ncbi:MAG: pyruvate kinase, partial [Erysipelotrichaceae bacterium]|nr:pyruvate kinase [Erysipelotrichaceae bacterium]